MEGFKPINYMWNITVENAVVKELFKLYDKEKTEKIALDIDEKFFKENYNKFTPGLIHTDDGQFNYTIKYYYIVLEEGFNTKLKNRYLYFNVVNIIKKPKKSVT